jgi:hypothetical protein
MLWSSRNSQQDFIHMEIAIVSLIYQVDISILFIAKNFDEMKRNKDKGDGEMVSNVNFHDDKFYEHFGNPN